MTLEVKSIGIEPSSGNCNNVTVIIASSMLNRDYKMSVLLKELKMRATLSLLFNFYNWRPVQKIRQQHFGSASIYCPSFFYQTILRGVLHTYLVGIGGGIRTHVLLSQNFGSWWWSSGHSACLLLWLSVFKSRRSQQFFSLNCCLKRVKIAKQRPGFAH